MIFQRVFQKTNDRLKLFLFIVLIEFILFFFLRLLLSAISFEEFKWSFRNLSVIFGVGLLYDLCFLVYFNITIILSLFCLPEFFYHKKWYFVCFSGLLSILLTILLFSLAAEWFFWDEFNVRYNFVAVEYLIYTTEVLNNIKESYPYKTILASIFILVMIALSLPRKRIYSFFQTPVNNTTKKNILLSYFFLLILVVLFMDQRSRDLIKNNYVKELASNGPYQFFNAYKDNKIDYQRFYLLGEDTELSKKLKELKNTSKNVELYDIKEFITPIEPEIKYNVVLISVESFSASFMTRFGNKENITPCLDKLANESMFFTNFYATGTRTVRGLESLSLAIPPTPGQSIVRRPDNHGFPSMGGVFSEHGYDSVFLYGGYGFFDNMNNFFSGNDYRIVDRSDFTKEEKTFTNAWGVADEDLLNKSLKLADEDFTAGKPFFFHIMTVSNHRPYTYPDNKIDIPSHTSRNGAVKYTDYAIGNYLENAKTKPWFSKTLFVIVADHCASSAGKIGLDVNSYHIPLIIYCPSLIKPLENNKLSSQIDLAPTIFGLLKFKYTSYFFGCDILSEDFIERVFVSNYQKIGYLRNNIVCVLGLKQSVNFYTYENKIMQNTKLQNQEILKETMAFYQGAEYILDNRIYRKK